VSGQKKVFVSDRESGFLKEAVFDKETLHGAVQTGSLSDAEFLLPTMQG
jgi:hypothetical protein